MRVPPPVAELLGIELLTLRPKEPAHQSVDLRLQQGDPLMGSPQLLLRLLELPR